MEPHSTLAGGSGSGEVVPGGARARDLAASLGQRGGAVVAVPVEQVGRGLSRGRRAEMSLAASLALVAAVVRALMDYNITLLIA